MGVYVLRVHVSEVGVLKVDVVALPYDHLVMALPYDHLAGLTKTYTTKYGGLRRPNGKMIISPPARGICGTSQVLLVGGQPW